MTETLNILPAATWRHLQVNQAPAAAALPEVPAEGFGTANTTLSPLPAGVSLSPLSSGTPETESGVGRDFDDYIRKNANHRLCLTVSGHVDGSLIVTHSPDGAHPAFSHLVIHAEKGARLTFLEIVRGTGLHGSLTEVRAEQDARVEIVQLQLLEEGGKSWSGLAAEAEEGAAVLLRRASLGGDLSLAGSRAALLGKNSEYDCRTVYFGTGDATLDFSDTAVHLGKHTHSEIHAAGALDGHCSKTLRGTIDFRRGAVHAVGHESEDVLLLSPGTVNRTAPLILCGEELVEGQHAATAGRIDENLLYYMASRGIDEATARQLLVEARFALVADLLPTEDLKCEVSAFMERRLRYAGRSC